MPSIDDRLTQDQPTPPPDEEELARRRAVGQIELRRRFHFELGASSIAVLLLTGIWAMSEYNNAGGWPTEGFSESSGIPNVWNLWIVYVFIAWLLFVAVRAWATYGHRPISDEEIRREIERQSGARRH